MNNLSLVVFTLLIQSAAGIVWSNLANFRLNSVETPLFPGFVFSVALLLILLGMISATVHLGSPRKAPFAASNFIHSRLSREIFAVQAFGAAVAGGWGVEHWFFFGWSPGLEIFISCLGLWAVWTVSQVYRLKTVPAWNHPGTPMDFFGTALLMGGVLSALMHLVLSRGPGIPMPFLCVSFVGGALKITALFVSTWNQRAAAQQSWYAAERVKIESNLSGRLFAYCLGLFLLFAAALNFQEPLQWTPFYASAAVLSVAEVWNRLCFYRSFQRMGL